MTKYFCDRCGKELYWRGMLNTTTNIMTAANTEDPRINCSGCKTYIGGNMWEDLCFECQQKLYEKEHLTFSQN